MAFVVEDGTGKADANALLSLAEFKAYQNDRGLSYAGKSDAEIEHAIVRATVYVGAKYRRRWKGMRTHAEQALDWPRTGVITEDYAEPLFIPRIGRTYPDLAFEVPPNVVPNDVKSATAMLAGRELENPGELMQVFERGGMVTATTAKAGPVSVSTTYSAGAPAATAYATVDGTLSVYMRAGSGQVPLMRG